MRAFVLAVLALIALVHRAQADSVSRETLPFEGRERSFCLFRPDPSSAPAPLVVLLHGSGGTGALMVQRWHALAAQEHLVLAAPDSLHSADGWNIRDDGPGFVHAVIAAAAERHPVDFRRIYLFGQSGGAVYALTLGMLESEYFAAVAFHAGGWRHAAEYRATAYARRKIPVAMFVGDQDEYFSLDSVRATERVLREQGFPAELHTLPGRRHAYADVPDDFHDTVWRFLQANSLAEAPKFAPYRLGAGATGP